MLKELFSKNPNIIINTDIDGFLSGMILQTYLGCKIVGFSKKTHPKTSRALNYHRLPINTELPIVVQKVAKVYAR